MKSFCILFTSLLFGTGVFAQTSISGIINTYTAVTFSDFCNNNVIVESAVGFAEGEKVLLIQMSGAQIDLSTTSTYGSITDYANAGNYEILTIQDVSFNVITFTETMERYYDATNGRVQLITIPEYDDVSIDGTLTASPWTGKTGGVLIFFAAGTVTFNAGIDVSTFGFKGGDDYSHTLCYSGAGNYDGFFCDEVEYCGSRKGESIGIELDTDSLGRGAPANGGGGGNDSNTGGGGGANYGSGGLGGERLIIPGGECGGDYPGLGGYALLYSNAENKIFMGGGGGSGDQNENDGTSGSPGGGIVIIRANDIDGNGNTIKANGKPVYAVASRDAAGGGGGGGTVLLDVPTYSSILNVEVLGGDGGDVDNNFDGVNCVGPGGGGGGGAVWLSTAAMPLNLSVNAAGGPAGSTINPDAPLACNGTSNFATAGNAGGIIYDLILAEPTTLFVPLTLTMDPSEDQILCEGDELLISSTATGTGILIYEWADGSTGTSISFTADSDETIQLTVTDERGCSITRSLEIEVIEKVEVNAYPDSTILQGSFVTLFTNLDPTYSYFWTPSDVNISDPTSFSPVVNPLSTTTYCVTVTDANSGCVTEDCITIEVIADVAIPNVFTPNGDGLNDYFRVPNTGDLCDHISTFQIFSRWGNLIYDLSADASGEGWNGTNQASGELMPIGTYIYYITMDCSTTIRTFSSDVILIR